MTRKKQSELVELLRERGPMTIREIAIATYGDYSRQHQILVYVRLDNARRAKLIQFAGFGERYFNFGKYPTKWRSAA